MRSVTAGPFLQVSLTVIFILPSLGLEIPE